MAKTRHEAMLRRSALLDAKLGELIETNISNSRARFRCVWHGCRADTARIVNFCANFIDALRRDARSWDALALRHWRKIKCFTPSNRHWRRAAPCAAAMSSESFEGVILRAITQKIGGIYLGFRLRLINTVKFHNSAITLYFMMGGTNGKRLITLCPELWKNWPTVDFHNSVLTRPRWRFVTLGAHLSRFASRPFVRVMSHNLCAYD